MNQDAKIMHAAQVIRARRLGRAEGRPETIEERLDRLQRQASDLLEAVFELRCTVDTMANWRLVESSGPPRMSFTPTPDAPT